MADKSEKKDEKAGGADASPKTHDAKGFGRRALGHGAEQWFLKIRKPAARWAARNIPNPMKDRMKTWAAAAPYISTLIATLTPDKGVWEQIDAFQQDFFDALESELKGGEDTAAPAPKPAFDEAKEIGRIMLMVAALPDQSKRDQFNHWFQDLKKTPDQWKTFLALAAASNDAELKALVQLTGPELNAMLAALPSPTQEKKPMTYLELRAAIAADAGLDKRVQDFLGRIGADLASKFGAAVERNIGSKIKSLEDFQAMMAMSDDEIKRYLKLDEKSVRQTINDNVAASGAVAAAGRFRDGTKGFFDKALARLS